VRASPPHSSLTVHTDSASAITLLCSGAQSPLRSSLQLFKQSGWYPALLIERAIAARSLRVSFHHVKAHQHTCSIHSLLNNIADSTAKLAVSAKFPLFMNSPPALPFVTRYLSPLYSDQLAASSIPSPLFLSSTSQMLTGIVEPTITTLLSCKMQGLLFRFIRVCSSISVDSISSYTSFIRAQKGRLHVFMIKLSLLLLASRTRLVHLNVAKVTSSLCPFCSSRETIQHILFECNQSSRHGTFLLPFITFLSPFLATHGTTFSAVFSVAQASFSSALPAILSHAGYLAVDSLSPSSQPEVALFTLSPLHFLLIPNLLLPSKSPSFVKRIRRMTALFFLLRWRRRATRLMHGR
jgi:hypothetical protein